MPLCGEPSQPAELQHQRPLHEVSVPGGLILQVSGEAAAIYLGVAQSVSLLFYPWRFGLLFSGLFPSFFPAHFVFAAQVSFRLEFELIRSVLLDHIEIVLQSSR